MKFRIRDARARAAFTLVELLVTVAIFLVITGILLANFQRSRQADAVRVAALRLAADIERMRSVALAGGLPNVPGALAYGIHVEMIAPLRYTLFSDRSALGQPANGRFDAGEELTDGVVRLPASVRITAVDPAPAMDILFTIPNGTLRMTGDVLTGSVLLAHEQSGDAQVVYANRIAGQVHVESVRSGGPI